MHGVETIVEAARLLRGEGVRFLLIGAGQTFGAVQRARDEGLQLELSQPLAPAHLVQRLKHAHVLLGIFGTTAKAARVVPNKIFQSLALGRAVVTAATPAIEDFFTPGEHLCTVPRGDPAALAEAIRVLQRDRRRREGLAARGARIVHAEFTPERVASCFLAAGQRLFDWPRPAA